MPPRWVKKAVWQQFSAAWISPPGYCRFLATTKCRGSLFGLCCTSSAGLRSFPSIGCEVYLVLLKSNSRYSVLSPVKIILLCAMSARIVWSIHFTLRTRSFLDIDTPLHPRGEVRNRCQYVLWWIEYHPGISVWTHSCTKYCALYAIWAHLPSKLEIKLARPLLSAACQCTLKTLNLRFLSLSFFKSFPIERRILSVVQPHLPNHFTP